MITRTTNAAENLFKQPVAEQGSNAAKLHDIRSRLALRDRETRAADRTYRLERRVVGVSTVVAQ
jgi:hypothetical protein